MRLTSLLPLAAILVVGSCRDATDPVTGLTPALGAGSDLFSSSAGITVANAAGTYVRDIGGQTFKRITAAGAEDIASPIPILRHIDESGTVFGVSGALETVFYWEMSGSKQDVSTPTGENPTQLVGKRLGTGEVIIAVDMSNPSATPGNMKRKLLRWSSVSGWQTIATSLSVGSPNSFMPVPHGIADDGSIVWSRYDPNLNVTRLYRTELDDDVVQYQVPSGHIDGLQRVASGNIQPYPDAVAPDGAVVGASYNSSGHIVPVRWDANGTPTILPYSGTNTEARAINGDYVLGTTYVTASAYAPIRWKWNGSGWDSYTFPALSANSGPSATRINQNGMVAIVWGGIAEVGVAYGLPGSMLFRADNIVNSNGFIAVDNAGRVYQSNGIITPEPQLTTAASKTAGIGVPMTLPVQIATPLGAAAYPISWIVRWQWGEGGHSQGTFASPEDVRGIRHTYQTTEPLGYVARMTITDALGNSVSTSTNVTVVGAAEFPSASVTGHEAGIDEGDDVVLTSTSTEGASELPLSFKWQFNGSSAGSNPTLTRRGVPRGTHSWRLIVSNGAGMADTATGTVTVENAAPIARFVAPKAPIHEASGFDLSVAALKDAPTDIDGVEIQFNCGTGYGVWGASESKNCDGLPQGSYTVGVKLRDELGAVREYTGALTVKNRAPVVTIDHVEGVGAGQIRIVYRISDYVNDGPWVVTLQRNGTRAGGTQTTLLLDTDVSSVKILGQNGDVITVRVKDKDGAVSTATIVVSLD